MNRITGRSAFLALLKDEGITHLFGNPGTTELPMATRWGRFSTRASPARR